MFSKITSNIKVSVDPEYDSKNSYPSENRYVFKYNIVIENDGDFPIKVLKRKWLIFDVGFGFTEVVGDGVIGLTPDVEIGDNFAYFSNVMLRSGVGNMSGKYLVENSDTKEQFEIDIPKFNLLSQVLSN
ncbi:MULTISPECIES: Co2+/Mg2+ efflux protein ApaG [Chryseobacterium]|jgi:ApaG protein|uniref:ApaG protein n=1 Tax=Chryseobacterium indoltheticum TaxID=254 RepID=A0A381F8P1_9FLAO|nr:MULTISPECIES: Co2+/Mg2+ efflux protein ApaG [Chryseobacterium]AZA59665.1 Co2+/Mg2+ efflux protein ApaG [Chryseobacterium indoltheticum]AZA74672.1 Co2+/Mg2+ efflux protein ApaG [Chryseobacterium indoltheticum]MDF2832663.1 Co2+/Mg2+ efflux protein ApaG [Chryseobacterium indoltheticum]MDQ8140943.1 Co2+/Mg2+ efflux protein ApaG [Chryseobacterium sp. CFS15]QQQ28531.1 Co2+/Mg2+ efflux protein ApaG [Chryseobacterium indoltheticum]